MPTPKRAYGAGSKRQQIIQYFRENPDARPVVVAKKFNYSPGATGTCKQIARETPLRAKPAPKPPVWANNLVRPKGFTQDIGGQEAPVGKPDAVLDRLFTTPEEVIGFIHDTPSQEEAPADLWRSYGLWMTREQYAGYLRGLAVSKLTRPILGNKDLLEINRIVTKLAEIAGS